MASMNQLIEELGRAFEEFKKVNDERLKTIEAGMGEESPEHREKLQKIEADIDRALEIKDRIEKMEARLDGDGVGAGGGGQDRLVAEHKQAFINWMRKDSSETRAALEAAERKAMEIKGAVTVGTGSEGGHAVPEELDRDIAQKLLDISPLRQICLVVTTGTGDYKKLVDTRGAASGWVGEGGTRSETGTPVLEQVAPTFGELYALPKTSEWALDDIFFDVEGWLRDSVASEFAKQEGIAFISGNGTNKPTGFLDGTPVTTGDEASPARAFGTLQYFPTGKADGFANSRVDSPPGDPGDVFMDTIYGLKAGYRMNARWLMSKATLGTVRKFKDADGDYLWRPGLEAGQPPTILGYPITEAEDMPDIAADAFPIAFGSFRDAYVIVDRIPMRVTRDDVTSKGHVLFYVRQRRGGKLYNDDALKLIKVATS